jgi:phospholipid/cholesterol/gamma-HCH transport system substrate-binding protein
MTFYRGNPLKVGLASVAALVLLIVLAITINASFGLPFNLSLFPPGQDYSVRAAFTDANGVIRGADVVIAGHTVGQVTGVEVQGKLAVVSMRVSRHYAPLHQFTTARIRYSTLLAQKYVEITPVNGPREIAAGGQISSDSTLSPVDFDQFLSALDPETRSRLQTLIQQAGGGLQGQQQTINDLLSQLHGLSQESLAPLSTFHQHDPDIDRIVANLAIVSNRLAASHQQLGDLVDSSSQVTGTLATNDRALASLIAHLGNVMGDFNATLNGNERNLHNTVVGLDPLLGELNGTLSIVYTDLHGSLAQINANTNFLTPESVAAVSQPGTDGQGNVLRQLFVLEPDCGTAGSKCQTGTTQSQPDVVAPALPSLPSLPNLPLCIPTPSPPKLPTPSVPALPCPSVSAPALPTPSCMPQAPKLPKLPTPSASVCPSVPGLSVPTLPPLGVIPDWLQLLLGAG